MNAPRLLLQVAAGLASALLLMAFSAAQAAEPAAGRYITERGWGRLAITKTPAGKLGFRIGAIGANAHSCEVEGEIRGGKAVLAAEEKGARPCTIRFTPKAQGAVEVEHDGGECRAFCGARADFAGTYLTPAAGCDDAERGRTRKQFKQLYDARSYPQALATLAPLLQACGPTLDWLETGRIRNDLAVTQHKLGDLAGCLQTLAPLAEDARRTDEQIRSDFPPTDAESYAPIVRATRTNLRLCGAKDR